MAGQVDRDHVEMVSEQVDDRIPRPAREPLAVEQDEGLTPAAAIVAEPGCDLVGGCWCAHIDPISCQPRSVLPPLPAECEPNPSPTSRTDPTGCTAGGRNGPPQTRRLLGVGRPRVRP